MFFSCSNLVKLKISTISNNIQIILFQIEIFLVALFRPLKPAGCAIGDVRWAINMLQFNVLCRLDHLR